MNMLWLLFLKSVQRTQKTLLSQKNRPRCSPFSRLPNEPL